MGKIIYTLTDEAPRLATYSLLPVLQAYGRLAGVEVETRDHLPWQPGSWPASPTNYPGISGFQTRLRSSAS